MEHRPHPGSLPSPNQPTRARRRAAALRPPPASRRSPRDQLAVLNMLALPAGREKRSLRCTPCACHQRHERVWATPCRATAGQCCSATPFLLSLLRLGQLAIAPSTLWLWALPCRRRPGVVTLPIHGMATALPRFPAFESGEAPMDVRTQPSLSERPVVRPRVPGLGLRCGILRLRLQVRCARAGGAPRPRRPS